MSETLYDNLSDRRALHSLGREVILWRLCHTVSRVQSATEGNENTRETVRRDVRSVTVCSWSTCVSRLRGQEKHMWTGLIPVVKAVQLKCCLLRYVYADSVKNKIFSYLASYLKLDPLFFNLLRPKGTYADAAHFDWHVVVNRYLVWGRV